MDFFIVSFFRFNHVLFLYCANLDPIQEISCVNNYSRFCAKAMRFVTFLALMIEAICHQKSVPKSFKQMMHRGMPSGSAHFWSPSWLPIWNQNLMEKRSLPRSHVESNWFMFWLKIFLRCHASRPVPHQGITFARKNSPMKRNNEIIEKELPKSSRGVPFTFFMCVACGESVEV